MICDRDCFNCPHPDCCNDLFDQEDYEDLLRIDKMLFPEFYTEAAIRERAQRRKCGRNSRKRRGYDPAKRKAYYEQNKQRFLAYQRDYDKINQAAENQKCKERRRAKVAQGGKA